MSGPSVVGYDSTATLWRQIRYPAQLMAAQEVSAASVAATPIGGAATALGAAPLVSNLSVPAPSELPYVPEGYGPEELATRARTSAPDLGTPLLNALEGKLSGLENDLKQESVPGIEDAKSVAEAADEAKCETCEERKYQDGSDDPGVSFKTAQHIDPQMASYAVRGHEQEHVVRDRAEAEREGRKVVSQTVTYHTGICPECGKFYVSGGTTCTVTAADNSEVSPGAQDTWEQDGFDING